MEDVSWRISDGTDSGDIRQQSEEEVMANQMDQYLRTLDFVNQSSGDKSVRQDERQLDIRLRVGEVYAVRATDNPD